MSGGFRRTWDKDHYKAKALERLERGENYDDDEEDSNRKVRKDREEFKPASSDAAGPMGSERAFIKARSDKLGLEGELNCIMIDVSAYISDFLPCDNFIEKIGQTEVVKPVAGNTAGGFFCEVCKCLLKDSSSYLDHINGKKREFWYQSFVCTPVGVISWLHYMAILLYRPKSLGL